MPVVTRSQFNSRKRPHSALSDVEDHASASSGLWLDVLPLEVCELVAAHVSRGRRTEPALYLALTSPKQRQAVIASLSNRLAIFQPGNADHEERWAKLLMNDVVEVAFEYNMRPHIRRQRAALLKAPKLRHVLMFNHAVFLRAIAQSSSITELSIAIPSRAALVLMFKTFAALKLKNLTMLCMVSMPSLCIFNDSRAFKDDSNALLASCPNLESLGLFCYCNRSFDHIFRKLPLLESLREVQTNRHPPDEILPWLSTLASVQLRSVQNAQRLAVRIGAPVTELMFCKRSSRLHAEQISALGKACPRLSSAAFSIKADAEVALAETVRSLHSLTRLELHWKKPYQEDWQPRNAYYPYSYVEASPGALLRIVAAACCLTELRLIYIRLPITELKAILGSLGSRLQRFTTSISDQDETPFDRLEILLNTVTVLNPGLVVLRVTEHIPKLSNNPAELKELSRQGRRMRPLLDHFQRRTPRARASGIAAIIEALIRD